MMIDLHVHTKLSGDGRSTREKLAVAAASRGLDAIVLTDHGDCAVCSPERLGDVWLLPGYECSTDAGHILGLFLDRVPDLARLRAKGPVPAAEAVAAMRECGGVTVLAHPFSGKKYRAEAPVDCIETVNARACFKNPDANIQAEKLAISLGLPQTGGSDAHSASEVGNAYTVIEAPDCSLPALREAVLNGRCSAVFIKNTPRRKKGLSQFRDALNSRKPRRILKGVAYIGYCIMLDIFCRGGNLPPATGSET